MNNYELAEKDRIMSEVYAIINSKEMMLVPDFEEAKMVVEKITEYIQSNFQRGSYQPGSYQTDSFVLTEHMGETLADGTKVTLNSCEHIFNTLEERGSSGPVKAICIKCGYIP